VVVAIKDQDLTTVYPNLSRQFAVDAGFVAPLPVTEVSKDSKSENGKSLVINLNDSTITKESFGKPTDSVVEPVVESVAEPTTVKRSRGRPRRDA
jgi:type III secretory pathway component EscV